jgi:drug/metabolite transporter (DMT)-like permease
MIPKLAGIGAILLWSSLALLTAASGAVPPFELAALTFAVGGGLGLIVTAARGRLATLRQPWPVWAVGVGGLFGYHALYFAALRHAPPAQAGLIAYLWPLLIVLLSAALPGHRLSPRHLVGAALGLGGVGLLVIDASSTARFDPRFATGYALAFVCAFVWSGYSVLSRRFRSVPTEAVTGFCLVTAALATIAHRATEVTVWPESGREWAAIVALGLGPVGAAFFLWDHGVKHGDIRALGVLSYAAPVLSTLILVLFGFAQPTASLGAACGLIVVGAAVASWKPRTARKVDGPREPSPDRPREALGR